MLVKKIPIRSARLPRLRKGVGVTCTCSQLRGLSQERSFFFLVCLMIPQFGLLCHISSLRLSSGHWSPILTLKNNDTAHASLPSPHLLLADTITWAASPQVFAVRHIFCGFSFSSPVMLPSEIPKLPTDTPMRGFPIVCKLLLLHDFFPRTGLHP